MGAKIDRPGSHIGLEMAGASINHLVNFPIHSGPLHVCGVTQQLYCSCETDLACPTLIMRSFSLLMLQFSVSTPVATCWQIQRVRMFTLFFARCTNPISPGIPHDQDIIVRIVIRNCRDLPNQAFYSLITLLRKIFSDDEILYSFAQGPWTGIFLA
jgi:hypothetical protein